MNNVAVSRRPAALVIAVLLAMLVVGGAMLFGMGTPAQAQETPPPCTEPFCLDKTVNDSTVNVGEQITFTITERCPSFCSDANPLVDQLPSGLTVDSVEDSDPNIQCTETSGNTVTCGGGRTIISADQPFTLTIVATTRECGTFTNTASHGGAIPGMAEATFTVEGCPTTPTTKEQCKKGGFEEFGYPDQGTCVSDVNRRNRQ